MIVSVLCPWQCLKLQPNDVVHTLATWQMRDLASELGVDVDVSGTSVIDHFSHAPDDASHTSILSSAAIDNKAVFGAERVTVGSLC